MESVSNFLVSCLMLLNYHLQVIPRNLLHRSNGAGGGEGGHGIEIAPESVLAATFLRLELRCIKTMAKIIEYF